MTNDFKQMHDDDLRAMMALEGAIQDGVSVSEAVRSSISKYPHEAAAIADYAIHAASLGTRESHVVVRNPAEADALDTLIDTVIIRKQQERASSSFASLLSRAEAVSGSGFMLTEMLSISHSLLVKLDRRLIRFTSIPDVFLLALAEYLRITRRQLDAYLQQPSRLASAADYKSKKRPAAGAQQTFADALASSISNGELSTEAAIRWQAKSEL